MTPEIYLVKVNSPIDENTFQYLLKFVQEEKQERILKQKIKQRTKRKKTQKIKRKKKSIKIKMN